MDAEKKKFYDSMCFSGECTHAEFIAAETAWQLKLIADSLNKIVGKDGIVYTHGV